MPSVVLNILMQYQHPQDTQVILFIPIFCEFYFFTNLLPLILLLICDKDCSGALLFNRHGDHMMHSELILQYIVMMQVPPGIQNSGNICFAI